MTFDWNAITAQGPIFWIACGSVALGVAMIAAAALAQIRRLRAAVPSAATHATALEPDPTPDPRPVAASPARIPATAPPIHRSAPEIHRRRLGELLERLERVAASLEMMEPADFPAPDPERPATAPETPLKESPAGVEYVFRAAGG